MNPASEPPHILEIIPVGAVEGELLTWLAGELDTEFAPLRSVVSRFFAPRAEWQLPGSSQHRVDALLDALIHWHTAQDQEPQLRWRLGLTELDLTAPGRAYVFGQATIAGCCAVVSLAQLRPGTAQSGEGRALLRTRVLKEAMHELGHVAGLEHCENAGCVMYASPDLRATDDKSASFCPACTRHLPEHLRNGA